MSKKQLQVDGIINELEGASLFFKSNPITAASPSKPEPPAVPMPDLALPPAQAPVQFESMEKVQTSKAAEIKLTTPYNEPKSSHASSQASTQANKPHDLVKTIRKTVRQVGKEVLFVRLSPNEKHTLGSIVYAFNEIYRGEGYKTSENEIGRIGLNFLLEDYRGNGNNSILAQVLAALIA